MGEKLTDAEQCEFWWAGYDDGRAGKERGEWTGAAAKLYDLGRDLGRAHAADLAQGEHLRTIHPSSRYAPAERVRKHDALTEVVRRWAAEYKRATAREASEARPPETAAG